MKLYFPLIFFIMTIIDLAVYLLLGINNHSLFSFNHPYLTILEIVILASILIPLHKKGISEKKIPFSLGISIIFAFLFFPSLFIN